MKKNTINFLVDIPLLICFIVVGTLGLSIFPGLLRTIGINLNNLPKIQFYFYHHWFGLLLIIISLIHITLHLQWYKNLTKKIFNFTAKKQLSTKLYLRYLLNIGLLISFILIIVTGILKFPGLLPSLGVNPLSIPINLLSFIHDWAGLTAVILSTIHLILHISWIITTIKKITRQLRSGKKSNQKGILSFAIILIITLLLMILLFYPGFQNPSSGNQNNINYQKIKIESIGSFFYNPSNITTIRQDIFQPGSFSIFDILVHLDNQNEIQLYYHFDETLNTHVIESINDISGWWYYAYYYGGWRENNIFRMDHYPIKEKMTITLYQENPQTINKYNTIFENEITKRQQNNGKIIIPEVIIQGTQETLQFSNIEVTPHNLRNDIFQDSIITAIDVIMTLGELGEITYNLQWYESIGFAEIVKTTG